MRITYVNLWGGFEENKWHETGFLTETVREIYPNCEVSLGYEKGVHYDIVFSMFAPFPSSKFFLDMKECGHKSICFTGESYDIVQTTPNCDAYIGYDMEEDHQTEEYDYLRFPLYAAYHIANLKKYGCNNFEELRNKFMKVPTIQKFSAVVSNPSNLLRTSLIEKLISMGLCDSGGRVLNNTNLKKPIEDKLIFCSERPINIAFENLSKKSYITEKIYEAYISGCVPFYWGAPDISDEFNPDSFILFDTTSLEKANESVDKAISLLTNREELNKICSVDPATGFRSHKYMLHGKQILKNFIMNIMEKS